ncbi:hypothetical protein [Rufibacter quisquiliarum]|uniref:Universal stress protein n=1 Tax=Rufibacter quisquiliarum TaxID=1549639 RepID=A0A839GAS1_9BACT|nr:hypothetical protein [Rufibacter quisquiliarum]MBA9075390.1 hypothetical protein [Rufibacter quisquiliarum]
MTHVLLPSNFQEDSFASLVELTETFSGLPLKVVLFHALEIPTSITELLMLPREGGWEELAPKGFAQKCQRLVQELGQIQELTHTVFYGNTQRAFTNFLKAHRIDFMAVPKGFCFQALSTRSQNPLPFLEKAVLPLVTISPGEPQLAQAFA